MAGRNSAEFLDNVLLRPGPSDLPYAEDAKWTIRQHVLDLVQEFDSLHIKLKNYTRPDGRSVVLLLVEGTLPIYYRSVRYNIPIVLWLPEKYPRQQPYAYVTPTPDMIVKPNHSFVDATGLVRSTYFNNWQFPRSNLNEMAHDMAIQFGSEPPLYSKPPGWSGAFATPQPPPAIPMAAEPAQARPGPAQSSVQAAAASSSGGSGHTVAVHNPLQQGQGAGKGMFSSIWSSMLPHAAPQPRPAQQPAPAPQSTPVPQPAVPSKQQLQEAFRAAATDALAARLLDRLISERQAVHAEVEELVGVQGTLAAREAQLDRLVSAHAAERDSLEHCLTDMQVKGQEMADWLVEWGDKMPAADIDPDAAVVPSDPLSGQALDAHALDLAVEETLWALDKALQRGALAPEVYLKQVRQMCRKQYYARALGNHVAARQQQAAAALTQPAQRSISNASLQMPTGDSWVSTGVLPNPLAAMR